MRIFKNIPKIWGYFDIVDDFRIYERASLRKVKDIFNN